MCGKVQTFLLTQQKGFCCFAREYLKLIIMLSSYIQDQHRCVRRAYGGAILGSVMGIFAGASTVVFAHPAGLMDLGQRLRANPQFRAGAVNQFAKSMGFLAMWTCLFQTVRCIGSVQKVDEPLNTGAAVMLSIAPFVRTKVFQRHLPWVIVSVALDVYHRPAST